MRGQQGPVDLPAAARRGLVGRADQQAAAVLRADHPEEGAGVRHRDELQPLAAAINTEIQSRQPLHSARQHDRRQGGLISGIFQVRRELIKPGIRMARTDRAVAHVIPADHLIDRSLFEHQRLRGRRIEPQRRIDGRTQFLQQHAVLQHDRTGVVGHRSDREPAAAAHDQVAGPGQPLQRMSHAAGDLEHHRAAAQGQAVRRIQRGAFNDQLAAAPLVKGAVHR